MAAVMNERIAAETLVDGAACGPALVLEQTLSFWGGFDPQQGEIIDVHHPQKGERVAGKVLCISSSKGSAGTPGGIAENLRTGNGPLAFVLAERDVNISIGVLVANRLYGLEIPVLCVSAEAMAGIASGDEVSIDSAGELSVSHQR